MNPRFSWRVTDRHGGLLKVATGSTISVEYDVAGATENDPLVAFVHASMDDDFHLLDEDGRPPSATLKVEGSAAAIPSPHPRRPRRTEDL